jgi:hypothetical protein
MAKIVRSTVPQQERVKATRTADDFDASLPTEYEEPSEDLNEYAILVHGRKKWGKTTLSMQGGNVFVIQFDPARKAYRRKERVIVSWKHFLAILANLERGKVKYDRVVIDGVADWYAHCLRHVCTKLAIDDPGEESHGKGWMAVRKEFTEGVRRVLNLPCGRWFLAHSDWKTQNTRHGEILRLVPNLPKQADDALTGRVDAWFAADYVGDRRVLVMQGNQWVDAGHCMSEKGAEHFVTPNKRIPVRELDMGDSPEEAYKRLLDAFNNRIKTVRVEEGVTAPPQAKSPMGGRNRR